MVEKVESSRVGQLYWSTKVSRTLICGADRPATEFNHVQLADRSAPLRSG